MQNKQSIKQSKGYVSKGTRNIKSEKQLFKFSAEHPFLFPFPIFSTKSEESWKLILHI